MFTPGFIETIATGYLIKLALYLVRNGVIMKKTTEIAAMKNSAAR